MAKTGLIKRSAAAHSHIHTCKNVPIITSMEETLKILAEKIDKTSLKIDTTITQIDDIKKRLFIDNGTPSIQSRLTLNENLIKDLSKKVGDVEEDINVKLDDMKQLPKTYISYTVGLIMFLGSIISGLIWLIKHV